MTTTADISFWTLLAAVAGGVAALAAIISICWLLYKWKYRPRFLVGAIPFEIDKKYWMTEDPIDEATFSEDYFAIKYRCDCPILGDIWEFLGRCRVKFDEGKYSRRKLENLKKGKHTLRCRTIEMLSSDQHCVALRLLLKNIGRMNAKKLRLAVNFTEQDIDILDIKTETFLVDALYSQNPEGNRLSIEVIELKIRSQVANLRTSNRTQIF